MAKRTTRHEPRETVAWRQDEKRVIRISGDDFRAEIGQQVIGYFRTAHEAEQACNAVVYDALNERKAA